MQTTPHSLETRTCLRSQPQALVNLEHSSRYASGNGFDSAVSGLSAVGLAPHRRRADDVRLSTETLSRRSVQPACSIILFPFCEEQRLVTLRGFIAEYLSDLSRLSPVAFAIAIQLFQER